MARDIVNTGAGVGRNSLVQGLFVGAIVGFLGWLLTLAINSWVMDPVFCRSADTASICSNSGMISWASAFIIMSVFGLFMLIRGNVFRPLLVVLAVMVTLWATGLWFLGLTWWVGLIWSTVLFALAYLLYVWLAATDNFVVSIIATVIIVVLMRLIIAL